MYLVLFDWKDINGSYGSEVFNNLILVIKYSQGFFLYVLYSISIYNSYKVNRDYTRTGNNSRHN